VLFYGRFLPLHGTDTIVEAAGILGERPQVVMIGSVPERAAAEARARAAGTRIVWRDDVPLAALPAELEAAAVVLGVFGPGRKAAMVVPNKVYQAAAVGRPLVTRDGPGLREVLEPEVDCLACPPDDASALAAAVARLLDDRGLAERLGQSARARVTARFAPARQAMALAGVLAERLGVTTADCNTPRAAGG
jgi:glycosyltransferase involved in cell wall biosynthesis